MKTEMTDEQKRIRVAELCGWRECGLSGGKPVGIYPINNTHEELPDYLNSLDAMHAAEKQTVFKQVEHYMRYLRTLSDITGGSLDAICATARQRAEAFLLTMDRA